MYEDDGFMVGFVVVAVVSWGLVFIGGGALVVRLIRRARKKEQVRKNGLPGEATVLQYKATPMFINRSQVFDFLLEVRLPGQAPYQVSLSSRWHDWNVRVMDVGLRLNVKVDPEDPQEVVVLGPVVAQDLGRFLREGMDAMATGQTAHGDPVKALTDLQRMADAGLVSEEEYARKRAEILDRL
ncbi:gas vesicle protein GvpG [Corallococcus sp. M7]